MKVKLEQKVLQEGGEEEEEGEIQVKVEPKVLEEEGEEGEEEMEEHEGDWLHC